MSSGFDLVGQEDAGRPLIHFAKRLIQFREEVDRLGLDIPFLFHAGETLGDGGLSCHRFFVHKFKFTYHSHRYGDGQEFVRCYPSWHQAYWSWVRL